MITTFTLGFTFAITTGVFVWMLLTICKLRKKLSEIKDHLSGVINEQSRFQDQYWRTRDDDQNSRYRQFDDFQRHIDTNFVKKEEIKNNKKTLLKG